MTATLTDYRAWVRAKTKHDTLSGFEVDARDLNPRMRADQRAITQWALARGRAAEFIITGGGKALNALEWAHQVARRTDKPVIMFAPLAVADQFVDIEAPKWGYDLTYVRNQDEANAAKTAVVISNYELMDRFTPDAFTAVAFDECFAPDTLIDTPDGERAIRDIRTGDTVFNAIGVDLVHDVHRRPVEFAVRVTYDNRSITCSPNHPFFTQRGWVGAQDLRPGDGIIKQHEAVRMVRGMVYAGYSQAPILRDILLSEMADEATGDSGEDSFTRGCSQTRQNTECMVEIGRPEGTGANRAHSQSQPDDAARDAREGLPHIESHEAQTFRAWWQWDGLDQAAADSAGCTWRRMASGIRFATGQKDTRLSDALQARLGKSRAINRDRGGWLLSSLPQESRREEGCEGPFAWVDGAEILEQGHPELEQWRDADGHVYFYDIGATQHPSFSVNGCLVHNSSIIKESSSATRNMVNRMWKHTPYRLALTATPAPNDHDELGNHSQALGIMPWHEMITRWFIRDSNQADTLRLKGHAEEDFWRWVASWAVCMSKPSDLGFDDAGFILPPLRVEHLEVAIDPEHAWDKPNRWGQATLMPLQALSATELHANKKVTLDERVAAATAWVNRDTSTPCVVWVERNDEGDKMRELLPEAVEVRGDEPFETKRQKLRDFSLGNIRVLITKPAIAGFGMNWQHCHRTVIASMTFSFERTFQLIRRFYRYGQTHPVELAMVSASTEGNVVHALQRKEAQYQTMQAQMNRAMRATGLLAQARQFDDYDYTPTREMQLPAWLKAA